MKIMKRKRVINKGKSKGFKSIPYKLSPVTHERMKQIRWAVNKTYDVILTEMLNDYERKPNA
jgi:hypothetical protein